MVERLVSSTVFSKIGSFLCVWAHSHLVGDRSCGPNTHWKLLVLLALVAVVLLLEERAGSSPGAEVSAGEPEGAADAGRGMEGPKRGFMSPPPRH